MNANMSPNARVPRNAICIWQSNKTVAALAGAELSTSLRRCFPRGDRFYPGEDCLGHDEAVGHTVYCDGSCNDQRRRLVHPKDWPSRCGYEALRATAEDLRRNAMWEGGSLHCS